MSNDQLDQQVVELDNLSEQREIVTFMRRSTPLNTSQRTALGNTRLATCASILNTRNAL